MSMLIRMALVVSFLRTLMFRYSGLPNISPVNIWSLLRML